MTKPIDFFGTPVHSNNFLDNADYFLKVLNWVNEVRNISPELFNWVGIYYKTSYLKLDDSTDLILGPFIGEPTDHTRIPIDRGLCGLALREERVVNQADVHADERHIACSLKTKSELIIPIKGLDNNFIAEIDIDSHTVNAFSEELENKVKEKIKSFPLL